MSQNWVTIGLDDGFSLFNAQPLSEPILPSQITPRGIHMNQEIDEMNEFF